MVFSLYLDAWGSSGLVISGGFSRFYNWHAGKSGKGCPFFLHESIFNIFFFPLTSVIRRESDTYTEILKRSIDFFFDAPPIMKELGGHWYFFLVEGTFHLLLAELSLSVDSTSLDFFPLL